MPFSKKTINNLFDFINETIYNSASSRIIFFLIFALFLVTSIFFFYTTIKKSKHNLAVNKATDLGEFSISLASFESLALTSLKNIKGIKELKVAASRFADGVIITIRLVIYPEVIITEMSKKIQTIIKSDIEAASGIKVLKTIVKIDNVTNYTMRSDVE